MVPDAMMAPMMISTQSAAWFLPFAAPICLYIMYTDMKSMKIYNHAVIALFAVFVVVGLIALPFEDYLWRYVHFLVALVAGIALTAARAMGGGDAKWIAAMAPFIHLGDLVLFLFLMAGCILVAVVLHRIAKYTPIRKLAPTWESWQVGKKFPMGLALGAGLMLYLGLGLLYGQPAT